MADLSVELLVGDPAVTWKSRGNVPFVDTTPQGVWDYRAGVDGVPAIPASARVLSFAARATDDDVASVTINGGDAIPLAPGGSFSFEPAGVLIGPTISFSGTESFFVEFVL